MRYLIGFFLFFGLFSVQNYAQEAKVIKLDKVEATQAKQLYQNLQSAQKEWDAFQKGIKETHLTVPEGDPEASNVIIGGMLVINGAGTITCAFGGSCVTTEPCDNGKGGKLENCTPAPKEPTKYERRGWENGFQFDESFEYIVPQATQTENRNPPGSFNYGCTYLTPATGIQFNSITPPGGYISPSNTAVVY
jgi:hypothetical protein